MSSEMLESALAYAALGWRVFPILEGAKDPPLVKWSRESSSDPAQVRRWWTSRPRANIGLDCGASGLTVVDLDRKPAERGDETWEGLCALYGPHGAGRSASTPSGGVHLYYSGSCKSTVRTLGRGVDTRGRGGYVLLPPSRTPAGAYLWRATGDAVGALPGWVADLAGAERERGEADAQAVDLDHPDAVAWAREHLAEAEPAVSGRGGNSRTFRVACVLRDRGVSAATALELMREVYSPRCSPPWSDAELGRIVEHAYAYASHGAAGRDTPQADFAEPFDMGEMPLDFQLRRPAQGRRDSPRAGAEAAEETRADVCRSWAYVSGATSFYHAASSTIWGLDSFNSHYGYLTKDVRPRATPSKQVFDKEWPMKRYKSMEFRPGEPPELPGETLNTWRPSGVVARRGDAGPLTSHLDRMLGPEQAGHLLDWMAWTVQHPTRRANYMPVVHGPHGCGKSWLGTLMSSVVGRRNTKILRPIDLTSRFNAWVMRTWLVVIHELFEPGDRRVLANYMKQVVGTDTVSVEIKGGPLFDVPNRMAIMAFTNYADAVRFDATERRYLVLAASAYDGGPGHWERMHAWLGGDGPSVALDLLQRREVPDGLGEGHAPGTRAREDMRRASLAELDAWLLEAAEDRREPFDGRYVAVSEVAAALPRHLERGQLTRAVPAFLAGELKARYVGQCGRHPRRVRLWDLEPSGVAMTPAQAYEAWCRQRGEAPPKEDDAVVEFRGRE